MEFEQVDLKGFLFSSNYDNTSTYDLTTTQQPNLIRNMSALSEAIELILST